jgi:hypothetical protein
VNLSAYVGEARMSRYTRFNCQYNACFHYYRDNERPRPGSIWPGRIRHHLDDLADQNYLYIFLDRGPAINGGVNPWREWYPPSYGNCV